MTTAYVFESFAWMATGAVLGYVGVCAESTFRDFLNKRKGHHR